MPQAGYVYILHGIDTAYIKIGKTTNLERRMGQLAQGVPFGLRLLFVELVHDMDHAERALKMRFHAFRTRGEWFELSPEALAYWPTYTPDIQPIKPLMVRPEKARPSLEERVLVHLETCGPLTARELQRKTHVAHHEIANTLLRLIDTDTVSLVKVGKRQAYLRLVSFPNDQNREEVLSCQK